MNDLFGKQPKQRLYVVYMATNKINGKRYIGASVKGLKSRRGAHLKKAFSGERGCPRFYNAIRKYGPSSFRWTVLKSFKNKSTAFEYERYIIRELRPEYNVSEGGLGPLGVKAWNRVKVMCLETGVVYESMDAAGRDIGVSSGDICNVCKGNKRRHTIKGFHFIVFERPLSEQERMSLIDQKKLKMVEDRKRVSVLKERLNPVQDGVDVLGRSAAGPMSNARKVVCLDDGRRFDSASAAAKYYGASPSPIIELCLGQRGRKTVRGLRFAYALDA